MTEKFCEIDTYGQFDKNSFTIIYAAIGILPYVDLGDTARGINYDRKVL